MIQLKNIASITRSPSGCAPLTPLPRNARDFRPVFCLYFYYWPAAARHPGFQPLSPPSNLHSPPVQLVPRRTLLGGLAGGGLVRLFLPRHPKAAVVLFIQSTYKNRLSCGVAHFSFKSVREDSIVVVSVMARHLPAWPPVGTTGASLMTSSSTVAMVSRYRPLGAIVAGQSVMGLRCSTSQCWLSIPMWNLNLQLRRIAIQKWRQQRSRICSVRSLCVAYVALALALVFMPGLYSTADRATIPAFLRGCR